MRKALTGLLTVLLVGVISAVVYAAVDSSGDDPAPAATTITTPDDSDARERRDRSRERDRAARALGDDSREAGEDISGPCDEAEHANDPRCTGSPAQPSGRADNSGPGGSDD